MTLSLVLNSAEGLFFTFVDGSNTGYVLSDVRKITFIEDDLALHLKNGTMYLWEFNTIAKYHFGNITHDNTQIGEVLEMSVFPNPAIGKVSLRYKLFSPEIVTVDIYDIQGRFVVQLLPPTLQTGTQELNWESRAMAAGVYYCRIQTDRYVATQPIVIVR